MGHKEIIKKLEVEAEVNERQAMIILGIICEERIKAYCEGQSNGYNAGYKEACAQNST